ncbi:MAG: MazG family protein [Clostridia bacterium]|nr:MazG family protein [Clostridia bacterium]
METDKKKLASEPKHDFESLRMLTRILREPDGCPWDREQDHKSIRNDMIEECYEVVEAIDTENATLLQEELGDVLFQVMFHAQIETEKEAFTIDDVIHDICAKMIHRHPHVFGSVQAETSEKVLANWEVIKKEEKARNTVKASMESVPPMLPALMRAQKVAGKAMKDGYAFGTEEELWEQIAKIGPGENREESLRNLTKLVSLAAILTKKLDGDLEGQVQKDTSEFIKNYQNPNTEEEHE